VRPVITETTAIGAAYLAGLAVGFWKDLEDIQAQWQMETVFSAKMDDMERQALSDGWKKAIQAAVSWSL
jgi:glycerol kinase